MAHTGQKGVSMSVLMNADLIKDIAGLYKKCFHIFEKKKIIHAHDISSARSQALLFRTETNDQHYFHVIRSNLLSSTKKNPRSMFILHYYLLLLTSFV